MNRRTLAATLAAIATMAILAGSFATSVLAAPPIVPLTAGTFHTCALTPSGNAMCWGAGGDGALGNGSTGDSNVPVAVDPAALSGVAAISAGWYHTCALNTNGGSKCWGDDSGGQLGNGPNGGSPSPVPVTGFGTGGLTEISGGGFHTCAITTGGGVTCWGRNTLGQLGTGGTSNSNVPVANPTLTSGVAAIAAGYNHSCAISGGDVWCWGDNFAGQLGDNSQIVRHAPVAVIGLTDDAVAVVAGEAHSCALTDGGGVFCWGENAFGQLGDSEFDDVPTAVPVTGLGTGVKSISSHGNTTCALTTAGAVLCWGDNGRGQVGDGTRSNVRREPVQVVGLTSGVVEIAAGYYHSCALTTSGVVKCWGFNLYGELGDGTNTNSDVPVDVAGIFGVADTTAPDIIVPADIVAEATSPAGASVTYTVTFSDPDDPVATSGCTPASGSTFPLGTTTVDCTATDSHGNSSSASFHITVQDTTAPTISDVPSDITVAAGPSGEAVVDYADPTATDLVDGSVAVTCVPPSGSTFPLGSTLVTCSATDSRGNSASASFTVTVEAADLEVTIEGPATPVIAGDPAGFDIDVSVTNLGPMDNAGGYTVVALGPGAFTFDPGAGCTTTPGGFECSAGGLAAAATDTYTVHVDVPASYDVELQATISVFVTTNGTLDSNLGNDSDNYSITVAALSDLDVSIAAPAAPQAAGDPAGFDYTISVRNEGPSDNSGAELTGTLPSGFSFESGVNCRAHAGGFMCFIGYLDAGLTASFVVHVRTDPATPEGTHVASVTLSQLFTPDPNSTNNTASAAVTLKHVADLGVTVEAPALAYAGDGIELVVSVTNHGPNENVGGYTVTGSLTNGVSFLGQAGCSVAPSGFVCVRQAIAAGTTDTFFVVLRLAPTPPAPNPPPRMTVTVASNGTPDENAANNSAYAETVLQWAADLGVTLTVPQTPQVPGDPDGFDLVIQVLNHGPSDSAGTHRVTVSVPPNTMIFTLAGTGCGATVDSLFCDGVGIASGSSVVYTVHSFLFAGLQPESLTLSANLTSTGPVQETNPANNTASAIVAVAGATADLAVTMNTLVPVAPGEDAFWTVSVQNLGPWDHVGGYRVMADLPAELVLYPSQGCAGLGPGGYQCDGGDLSIGATQTFQLRAALVSLPPTPVTLHATVTSTGTPDPNLQNDSAALPLNIVARADLSLTIDAPTTPQVAGGPVIEYTLRVSNLGPSSNQGGYVIRGAVPSGLTFAGGADCGTDATGFFCSSPDDLFPHLSRQSTVTFAVSPSFIGSSVLLQASVASQGTFDSNPSNNDANATVTVISRADMQATDLGSVPAPPIVLDASSDPNRNMAIFRLIVTNAGPSDARSAAIQATGIDIDEYCLVGPGIDCSSAAHFSATPPVLGTFAPGQGATVYLLVRAEPTLRHGPLTWNGVFTAMSATTDPSAGNDSKARSVVVNTVPEPVPNLRATPGNGNVVVSWAPPAGNGGAPLDTTTPYVLTVTSSGFPPRTINVPPTAAGPCLAPEGTICYDVTGLVNGRTYQVDVRAINRIGSSDAATPVVPQANSATPSPRSAAKIVAPNTTANFQTCSVATPTTPVCITQFAVQKGNGGIVAIQAGVSLPPTFCGSPCAGNVGALMFASSRGWTDIQRPFTATVNWDASLLPTQSAIYLQQGTGTPALLPRCTHSSKAIPDPCLRDYRTIPGNPSSPGYGDRSAIIVFTSDIGFVTVGQP